MIRPTFTVESARSEFVGTARRAALRRAAAQHNQLAIEWARALQRIIGEEFERREGSRHKPGTIHLDDSFQISTTDTFPVTTTLRTKNGVSSAKIRSLNNGARPHEIRPRPGNDQLAWRTETGGWFSTPKVGPPNTALHPGNPNPARFLERSRDEAVQRALR